MSDRKPLDKQSKEMKALKSLIRSLDASGIREDDKISIIVGFVDNLFKDTIKDNTSDNIFKEAIKKANSLDNPIKEIVKEFIRNSHED